MAQPTYYTYSGAFIPGTLARAEQVGVEYTAVQTGFAKLAYQGVDSGAANAYVVATSGGQCGAYTDGLVVEAKLLHGNTGGCTIAVDSGSTVNLTQPNGQSLASGAIVANNWYRFVYNSTYSAWTVVAPTPATTITSNTISAAPPTNKVGLVAAAGVSTACVPIDITFAIDQTIAPTWTGAHTFSNAVTFGSTVSFTGGLSLTGAANQYAATLNGNSASNTSFGLKVAAGTTASDVCALLASQSGTAYFQVKGEGSVVVGNPTGGGQGVGTINATNLYINGVAVSTVVGANPSASVGLSAVNGVATTFMRSDGAPALSQAIAPTWTGAHTFTPSSSGTTIPITATAPVNTLGLVLNGSTNTSNTYLMEILTGQGSGFSSGLFISAGTTSADAAFTIAIAGGTPASNTTIFQTAGNGQSFVYAPNAAAAGPTGCYQVGYVDVPQNIQTGNYTLALTDRGKHIYTNGATGTWTIPANASVAFPIGTVITLFNVGSGGYTISPAAGVTLFWYPSGTTGSRTLSQTGLGTLLKIATNQWVLTGVGIT